MAQEPSDPKIRLNTHDSLATKPGENEPGGWLHSPGRLSLFTSVEKALIPLARQRGQEATRIDFIRVGSKEGDPRIWIYPTEEIDPDRLRLRRYSGRMDVNLSRTFKAWKLTLPPRQRRRYDLLVDLASPVGPALYFNIDKPLEIRTSGKGNGEAAKVDQGKDGQRQSAARRQAEESPSEQGAPASQQASPGNEPAPGD